MRTILRRTITLFYLKLLLATLAIANPEAINAITAEITATHVTCFGLANGSADLKLTGGVAPFTFEWSNGAKTEDISGLRPGLYSVKVTDAAGATASACIEINQPGLLSAQVNAPAFLCTGASANIAVVASGGTAPYSFSWGDGATGASRSVTAGSYSVTVTDSKGCFVTKDISIAGGGNFDLAVSKTDVTCFGNYDGSASVTVSGSSETYSYSWSNGSTANSISAVAAGRYSVTVTDQTGCSASDTVIIAQPSSIQLSTALLPVTCSGAGVDVTVSGGVAPYRYFWNHGARTEDLSGLANGNYFLRVSDANGCIKSTSVTVSGVNLLSINSSVTPVSCSSDNDGAIQINVTGGVAPYSYNWSNGSTSQNISGLSSASYTVSVTDANSCSKSLTVLVPKDDPFDFDVELNDVSCDGSDDGAIALNPPAHSDFTYQWSHGETGYYVGGLSEGGYSVVVTTDQGCEKTMDFYISNPLPIELSTSTNSDPCASGSIDLTVSGGTSPYRYLWSNSATSEDLSGVSTGYYSVVVTDANGCKDSTQTYIDSRSLTTVSVASTPVSCFGLADGTASVSIDGENAPYTVRWSNNSTAYQLSNLAKGNYSVTVTDNYGCIFSKQVSITEPAKLNIALLGTNPSCNASNDGIVRSVVRGGTSPYTFQWNNGGTAGLITRVGEGSYSLRVTDANRCSDSAAAVLISPAALVVSSEVSSDCKGGSADITASGGTSPYTYSWNDGFTGEDRTGLTGQSYSVLVKDAKGCELSHSVIIPGYESMVVTVQVNGRSASSAVTGGSAPYTYAWSTGHTTSQVTDLSAGNHSITVIDASGCSATTSFKVEAVASQPLSASIDCCQDQAICKGEQSAVPVHFTGTGPFTFTYKVGAVVKSITTSDNPYYIRETLVATTTFSLMSVTNGCSSGPVCGQATIGVNDCGTRCEMTCFSAEVTEFRDYGDCRDIKLKVINNGNCKYGLSHLSISTPCGEAKNISNSRGFKVEKGTDPTTQVKGFKIDNISKFGEAKNGNEEFFYVEYTLCKKAGECFGDFCPPMVAFKASTCAYYVKSTFKQEQPMITPSTGTTTETDRISIYPNPASKNSIVKINMPAASTGTAEVVLVDNKGKEKLTTTVVIDEITGIAEVRLPGVDQGIYMIIVRKDGNQFFQKISVN